jgi:hypothetical protein
MVKFCAIHWNCPGKIIKECSVAYRLALTRVFSGTIKQIDGAFNWRKFPEGQPYKSIWGITPLRLQVAYWLDQMQKPTIAVYSIVQLLIPNLKKPFTVQITQLTPQINPSE